VVGEPLQRAEHSIDTAALARPHANKELTVATNTVGDRRLRSIDRFRVDLDEGHKLRAIIHKPAACDESIAAGTIFISDDVCKPLRQNYRMAYELLISRIEDRLKVLGLSERKACLKAGVGLKSIYHIKARSHAPKPDTLSKLAAALGVPPAYFLDAAPQDGGEDEALALDRVFVVGAVQAGVWREAIEWDGDDWYSVTPPRPKTNRFPGIERFGLEVRGSSMNRKYPEGTVVIVVRFGDIARPPKKGERVVVLRRSHETGHYEATLKEYDRDEQGRHILWPRSDDPEFQTPFILSGEKLPLSGGYEPLPRTVSAGEFTHATGAPDIIISALVVGSYQDE
jgi:repressor LexA